MKNRILLLSALTAIGFASCTNPNTSGTYTQEQLDSIVQYRVDSIAMDLKMQNDSLIYAMADSIAMATKSGVTVNKGNTKTTPSKATPKPAPTETKKPETIGNGKPKAGNQDANTIGNGKPKAGNQDANTIGNGKPKAGNQN